MPTMKSGIKSICLILFYISTSFHSLAQGITETDLIHQSIDEKSVQDFTEDENGKIWIGTRKGLFSYNGSTFLRFFPTGTSSLSSEFIMSLCADDDGSLWVGTDGGVNQIKGSEVIHQASLERKFVYQIKTWDDAHLVFSGSDGIYLYNKEDHTDAIVFKDPDFQNVTEIMCTGSGVWIRATDMHSVAVLDKDFNLVNKIKFGEEFVSGMSVLKDKVFLCTDHGLRIYSLQGQELILPPVLSSRKRKAFAGSLTESFSGHIYFAVAREGFYCYNPENDSLTGPLFDDDLSNVIFIKGIITKDVAFVQENFQSLKILPKAKVQNCTTFDIFLPGEGLISIHSGEDERIIAVTNKRILTTTTKGEILSKVSPPDLDSLGQITYSFIDSHGYIYLTGSNGLFCKYSMEGSTLTRLYSYDTGSYFVSPWEGNDGNICIISQGKIIKFTPAGQYTEYTPEEIPNGYSSRGSDGHLYYIGTNGIFVLDENAIAFRKLPVNISYPSCCTVDKEGTMWIGTAQSGLYSYNQKTGETKHFGRSEGLPDNTIRAVVKEGDSFIWVSTPNDIVRISTDGASITRMNYTSDVQKYEARCAEVLEKGWGGRTLLFGGDKSITFIDPHLQGVSPLRGLSLDALFVNNDRRDPNIQDITLPHDENQLVFYYSGMCYGFGPSLNYSYFLKGFDKNWTNAGQRRNAAYTNLPQGKYVFQVKVQGPDGTWSPYEINYPFKIKPSPLKSPAAYAAYLLALVIAAFFAIRQYHVIRKSKMAAQIAEMEKKAADKFFQDKINFLSNISHEFRTPLSLIYGPAIELGKDPYLSDSSKKLVSLIRGNVQRMQDLSRQVLDTSRAFSSEESLFVKETDLTDVLETALSNFSFMLDEKKLKVATDFIPHMSVWCDSEKILKIFTNLVSNAIKYTPKEGQISVSIAQLNHSHAKELYSLPESDYNGNYAEVSVCDSGIGIPKEKVRMVFQRYERIKDNISKGELPEGFGIGLNYALYLIEKHRGKIRVKPNIPEGSIFSFVFPVQENAYNKEEIVSTVEEQGMERIGQNAYTHPSESILGKSILIVEDNPQVRSFLVELLNDDFAIAEASDGLEAWERINEKSPDLVISDVMMPHKDGFTLCHEIKDNPEFCHIPVILLTAKAEVQSQISGLSAGADAYIPKPFDPDVLKVQVNTILANRIRLQNAILDMNSLEEAASDNTLSPKDKDFLDRIYEIAERHLDDEEFGIASFAQELNMSQTSFYMKVKGLLGVTPQNFLISYRLNKAMELLKSRNFNVSEVSYRVGFSSRSSFARSFKNKFGVQPSSV